MTPTKARALTNVTWYARSNVVSRSSAYPPSKNPETTPASSATASRPEPIKATRRRVDPAPMASTTWTTIIGSGIESRPSGPMASSRPGRPVKVIAFEPDKQHFRGCRLGDWNEQPARGWVEEGRGCSSGAERVLPDIRCGGNNREPDVRHGLRLEQVAVGAVRSRKRTTRSCGSTTGLDHGNCTRVRGGGATQLAVGVLHCESRGRSRGRAAAGDGPGGHRRGRGVARHRCQFAAPKIPDSIERGGADGVAAAKLRAAGQWARAMPRTCPGGWRWTTTCGRGGSRRRTIRSQRSPAT